MPKTKEAPKGWFEKLLDTIVELHKTDMAIANRIKELEYRVYKLERNMSYEKA